MTFKEFMQENGYELQTTFWEDFTIADRFGLSAIQDTFNRAFEEWKEHYKLCLIIRYGNIMRNALSLQRCIIAFGNRLTFMLKKTLKVTNWTIFMK